ncbi:hypothetical protein BGX31_000569 [Mortierella sp. GBA43]|nr:hypothetical protein BGX31_000569 [Mortierella sp. GBA43]
MILWVDIQDEFGDTITIRKGETSVPYLMDDNLTQIIEPLQIAYDPGTVIDVIVEENLQHRALSVRKQSSEQGTPSQEYHSITRVTGASSDMDTRNRSSVAHPNDMLTTQRVNPHLHTTKSVQESTEADTNQSITQLIIETHHQTMKTYHRTQKIEQLQHQTLDRLSVIDDRVEALFKMTYELHEYPIPRLFIVLRKPTRRRDSPKNLVLDRFRLYFLCECGMHNTSGCDNSSPGIHLARHEGYDLEKPIAFFEKYGSYVLTCLYIVKFGMSVAGAIVPPLATLKILDGLDNGQEHTKFLRTNIIPLVNDTIKALQGLKNIKHVDAELATCLTNLDKVEALEGAGLRQLRSYLKVKDQGRVFGNLYRTVTQEGQVKWVCFDHYYQGNNRRSAVDQLQNIIKDSSGTYIEEAGKIDIQVESSTIAKRLYDAMALGPRIQELDITLGWNATMEDLRKLSDAVIRANVISLTLDGIHFDDPIRDFANYGRRFDPILQLASDTPVKNLRLKNFKDVFSRVSKPALASAQHFRMFAMDIVVPFHDKAIKSLNETFGQAHDLTALDLKLHHQHSIGDVVPDILSKLGKLNSLKVNHGELSIAGNIAQGIIQDVDLTIAQLGNLDSDLKFIQKDNISRLSILRTSQKANDTQLAKVLQACSRLAHFQVACEAKHFFTVFNTVISTRESLREKRASNLQTFELMDENMSPFDRSAQYDEGRHIQCSVTFKRDSASFDMSTWIRLGWDTNTTDEDMIDFVRQYGWSIVYFGAKYSDFGAFVTILSDIASRRYLQLESLDIDTGRLSGYGLEHLSDIIGSPHFKDIGVYVYYGQGNVKLETTQSLMFGYGAKLSSLELYGCPHDWLAWVVSNFPTRSSFPKLELFGFRPEDESKSRYSSWIVDMVTVPSQVTALSTLSNSSNSAAEGDDNHDELETSSSCMALREIVLRQVDLEPEDWKRLIEAMDLSALQHLDLQSSNFSQEQYKLLKKRLPNNAPLLTFDANHTSVDPKVSQNIAALRKKPSFLSIQSTLTFQSNLVWSSKREE